MSKKKRKIKTRYSFLCPNCQHVFYLLGDESQIEQAEKLERVVKKIEDLKYNKPLDSEMRIVNMICRSAVSIVQEEFK